MEPMDRATFRRELGQELLIQLAFVIPCLALAWLGHKLTSFDLQFLALAALALGGIALSTHLAQKRILERRLLDIYPDHKETRLPGSAMLQVFPIAYVIFCLFLSMKNAGHKKAPAMFRYPRLTWTCCVLIMMLMPLTYALPIAFGRRPLRIPAASYFMDPTNAFVYSIGQDIFAFIELKSNLRTGTSPRELIDEINQLELCHESSEANLLLSTALIVKSHAAAKESKRLNSKTRESHAESLELIGDILSVLRRWDDRDPPIFFFNPLNFLSPAGTIPTAMMSLVELLLGSEFERAWISQVEAMITRMDRQIAGSRSQVENSTRSRAKLLLDQLRSSRTYASYIASKESLVLRHLRPPRQVNLDQLGR